MDKSCIIKADLFENIKNGGHLPVKTVLIILLILIILALLYFLFFRKKKKGSADLPAEDSKATAETVEAPAEELASLVKEEPAETAGAIERAVPAEPSQAEKYLSPVCLEEAGIGTGGKYNRIIAINLEAPNSENNKICEFAMAYDENGTKFSAVNLLDPEVEIEHETTRAMIEAAGNCPTFPELWKELYGLFDGSLVIAHNTAFDVSVLKKTIAAYGLDFPKFDVACTYRLSRKYHPELENFKLGTVCKFYDIPLVPEDAVSHGNACYEIFRKLIAEGIPVFEEAKEFSL